MLEYQGNGYVLAADLVKDKDKDDKQINGHAPCPYQFGEEYAAVERKELKGLKLDTNWAEYKNQLQSPSVSFSYDYDSDECGVTAEWKDNGEDGTVKFTTNENSSFAIIKKHTAMDLLEEKESKEGVFEFSHQDTSAIQVVVKESDQLQEKPWLDTFFAEGRFCFDDILLDNNEGVAKIEDVALYIDSRDSDTSSVLLKEFLLKRAEKCCLGYGETGRLVSEFQSLFTSPDGNVPACPPIEKTTEEVYQDLVGYAERVQEDNPIPYLHLQAYIDLSPADTLKPYIEKESVVNLTNQKLSFYDLVLKVFGEERTVEAVCLSSKYTAGNGRNARAVKLFAESVENVFGVRVQLFTTGEDARPKDNERFRESDRKWFMKMKECKCLEVKECEAAHIKSIHDRYYKLTRTNGNIEWWVLTAELDQLRFENDHPRIREDITMDTKGTVHEMTFSRIRQEGVPDEVKQLMEEE